MRTIILTFAALLLCTTAFALPSLVVNNMFDQARSGSTVPGSSPASSPAYQSPTSGYGMGGGYGGKGSSGNGGCGMNDLPNSNSGDGGYYSNGQDDVPPPNDVVPEPATLLLLGVGGMGLAVYRKLRK